MQRSLLPRSRPVIEGLEVGEVYEPSARVDVGGDVYDFLELDDGRLAVVLGDVTGHGVDATADMAMAKFVFRSLAREHPEPADFLASANEVICSEIAPRQVHQHELRRRRRQQRDGHRRKCRSSRRRASSFPTDRRGRSRRTASCSESTAARNTRNPAPTSRRARRSCSTPTESSRRAARASSTGTTASTRCSRERRELPARALAAAVAEDAREFAGGDLSDDLAVVVIRRT